MGNRWFTEVSDADRHGGPGAHGREHGETHGAQRRAGGRFRLESRRARRACPGTKCDAACRTPCAGGCPDRTQSGMGHAAVGRHHRTGIADVGKIARQRRCARRRRQRQLQGFTAARGVAQRAGSRVRRCRRIRWRVGSRERLRVDVRRGKRCRQQGRAVRQAPRARTGQRLDPLRPAGFRTLRQDDPQRHRIRNDAGLRRRPVDDESQDGIRP